MSSPDASGNSSEELARLRAKLELVTEDKRRAGEKNAQLNTRLKDLEDALKATQAQLKDGQTERLAESGEYKKLWEDAKETNLRLEREKADIQGQLDAERQARATETLKSRALSEIATAEARRPDQLLALISANLREAEGKPVVIDGGIEIPLAEHLSRLRAPDSGWEHHFAPRGAKGMGTAPSSGANTAPPAANPFMRGPNFNVTEQGRLYKTDRALYDKLQAEAKAASKR